MTGPGVLEWAVRDSFLDYVRALDDGQVSATDGAREEAGGFSFSSGDQGNPSVLRFTGTVSLSGHSYLLAVDIVDPWLELGGDGGQLTVAGPRPGSPRFAVARFDTMVLEGHPETRRWYVEEPLLTAEGAYWLGGYYPDGSALAPITVQLAPSSVPENAAVDVERLAGDLASLIRNEE